MSDQLKGKRISIPGQFTGSVTVESAKAFDDTWLLQVRDRQGGLHDAYLTEAEVTEILTSQQQVAATPVDANQFFLFMESARIKNAYEYDRTIHARGSLQSEHFPVSKRNLSDPQKQTRARGTAVFDSKGNSIHKLSTREAVDYFDILPPLT